MRNKASLSVIFATVFIDLMGFGILIPILPTFASSNLNISDFAIGIVVAIYSFNQFIFNPILGKLSDRIGRRPVIIFSLLITGISYLIFSVADTFFILLMSRMFAGFGGSNIGVAQAYIADITTKDERAKGMGLIGAAFGLGFVFGPLIGGVLSEYGYWVVGLGSASFSFLAMLFAVFFLPESRKKVKSSEVKSKKLFDLQYAKKIMSYPKVGLLIIIFFMIVFSMANIYGTFSLLGLRVYGFSDAQNGYLFGIIGIVGAIIQGGVIRYLTKIFTDELLVKIGIFLMMLGLTLLPYGISFAGAVVIVVILSIGTGILQPTILSMISKFTPEGEQGAILGINQSISAFARVLGPLWGGFAFEFIGFEFPFLTGGLFTFITLVITFIYLKSDRKTAD